MNILAQAKSLLNLSNVYRLAAAFSAFESTLAGGAVVGATIGTLSCLGDIESVVICSVQGAVEGAGDSGGDEPEPGGQ